MRGYPCGQFQAHEKEVGQSFSAFRKRSSLKVATLDRDHGHDNSRTEMPEVVENQPLVLVLQLSTARMCGSRTAYTEHINLRFRNRGPETTTQDGLGDLTLVSRTYACSMRDAKLVAREWSNLNVGNIHSRRLAVPTQFTARQVTADYRGVCPYCTNSDTYICRVVKARQTVTGHFRSI